MSSELGWGLILYGEEEEDYLATTDGIIPRILMEEEIIFSFYIQNNSIVGH